MSKINTKINSETNTEIDTATFIEPQTVPITKTLYTSDSDTDKDSVLFIDFSSLSVGEFFYYPEDAFPYVKISYDKAFSFNTNLTSLFREYAKVLPVPIQDSITNIKIEWTKFSSSNDLINNTSQETEEI